MKLPKQSNKKQQKPVNDINNARLHLPNPESIEELVEGSIYSVPE